MNIDEIHRRVTAELAGCDNPESLRAITLRGIVDMCESIVMPLEWQRIDMLASRIPDDVRRAIEERWEEEEQKQLELNS